MVAENVILFPTVRRAKGTSGHQSIRARFQSLRTQAKLFARHGSYSKAVEWFEKAFEFGIRNQTNIESKDVLNTAYIAFEYAYELPREDRNFCTPIHIARTLLKHFKNDDDDIFQSTFFVWLVLKEIKPVADSLTLGDQEALQLLDREKEQYPAPFKSGWNEKS